MDNGHLGGGFKHFIFSLLKLEMIQFDEYFSDGLTPPTRNLLFSLKKKAAFFFKEDNYNRVSGLFLFY